MPSRSLGGALPPAHRGAHRDSGRRARHPHAVPAREAGRAGRAPGGEALGEAQRVLVRLHRDGGERSGNPDRPDGRGSLLHGGQRGVVPRQLRSRPEAADCHPPGQGLPGSRGVDRARGRRALHRRRSAGGHPIAAVFSIPGRAWRDSGWEKPRSARARRGHRPDVACERRVRRGVVSQLSRQEAQHPHDGSAPVVRVDLVEQGTFGSRPDAGNGKPRVDARDVEQRPGLHVQEGRVLGGVGDLEDPLAVVLGSQAEVLIPLARQRAGGGTDLEGPPGDVLGLRHRERRGRLFHDRPAGSAAAPQVGRSRHRFDLRGPCHYPPTLAGARHSNMRRARNGTRSVSISSAISSPVAGLMHTPSPPKRAATKPFRHPGSRPITGFW